MRVGDAIYTIGHQLSCPRCGLRDHATKDAHGILTLTCSGKRCRVRWVALRLPPGSTGAQLVELYGVEVADALHRALCPDSDGCSRDALEAWVLPIPTTAATYLTRMPDTPEPAMGWARAERMLNSLLRSA